LYSFAGGEEMIGEIFFIHLSSPPHHFPILTI
jgi:hypothetical protein